MHLRLSEPGFSQPEKGKALILCCLDMHMCARTHRHIHIHMHTYLGQLSDPVSNTELITEKVNFVLTTCGS